MLEPASFILKAILNTARILLVHHNSKGDLIVSRRPHIHQVNDFQDIFHWKFKNANYTLEKRRDIRAQSFDTIVQYANNKNSIRKAVYTGTKSISVTWSTSAYGKVRVVYEPFSHYSLDSTVLPFLTQKQLSK